MREEFVIQLIRKSWRHKTELSQIVTSKLIKKKNSELLLKQIHHYLFDLKISILGIQKVFSFRFGHFEYKESFAQSWVKSTI